MSEKERHKFASMAEMAKKFRERHEPVTKLPLMDDSPADAWMSCGNEHSRSQEAASWVRDREKYDEPMDVRDFNVLVAYEANGAKMEAAFGWSSLGLWLAGLGHHANAKNELAMAKKLEYMSRMDSLIQTEASIDAFQAAYPNALGLILASCCGFEDNGWELAEILIKNGWNPNEWNPRSNGGASGSMHSLFEASASRSSAVADVAAARWESIVRVAQQHGFDINSRNKAGLTALGTSLKNREYGASKETWDSRVEGLINAGADHTMAAKFWLSAMEDDPVAQKAMASRMEAAQIKKAVLKQQHEDAQGTSSERGAAPLVKRL